ncbi:hypothetical protein U1Q18_022512 [Sarracenia purpurea var. burkii]
MAGQLRTKVRLVRCPKCHGILPELAPVYQCAVCGTVLQAKKWKNDTDTEQHINETNTAIRKIELEHVSGNKEAQNLSTEVTYPSSAELPFESLPVSGAHSEEDLEPDNGKKFGGLIFPDEVTSTETIHHESEESSPQNGVHSELDENGNCLEQNNGRHQNAIGDLKELPGNREFSNEISSNEFTSQQIEESSSPVAGTLAELDENNFKRGFIFGSLSGGNLLAASSRHSMITAQRSFDESNLMDSLTMSPHSEQLEQSRKRAFHGNFDRVSSDDTLENFALKDMPKSPTTRSYYGKGCSVSSDDAKDDHVPNRQLYLSKRKYKEAEYASSKTTPGGTQFETDEHRSKVPFYSRDYHIGCDNGIPSNYRQNRLQRSTSFYLPNNKPEYPEKKKMELLKMVYELEDQLKRAHISNHIAPEAEICHDLSNPGYSRRRNQGRNWPHRSPILGIPFSAEATTVSKHHSDCSCFTCCPHEWQCSAPLPAHIFCNKNRYISHSSQKYTGSEFSSWNSNADSDYHWHTNHHEVKKYYSMERHRSVKRHVLPVSGGAPFIVCYGCCELLQIPADFLLPGRRFHRLRCSSCSVILKFSLQNGTHIVPYMGPTDFTTHDITPPPSKVDDNCSDANNLTNPESVSNANYCLGADSVSCSDEQCEGDPFSAPIPLDALNKKSSNDRKISSGSSFEPMEERKKQPIFKESQNKFKNPEELFESVGYSSKRSRAEKLSSEIEEEWTPKKGGSPLHRLMGYSSPSEVMER